MATKTKTSESAPVDTITVTLPADFTLAYGKDHSLPVGDLSPAGFAKLLRGGFAHMLGNEVASKVTAAAKKAGDWGDAEKAIAAHDYRNAAIQALKDGTIGAGRTGGTRTTDLVEREYNRIAKDATIAHIVSKSKFNKADAAKVKNFPAILAALAARDGAKWKATAESLVSAMRDLANGDDLDIDIEV